MAIINRYQGRGKFKPQPRTIEGIRFDSELEATTYEAICHCVPTGRVLCHGAVNVLAESNSFNSWDWAVDFTVLSPCLTRALYVEAKGIKEPSFTHMLHVLSVHNPRVFNNLVLVTPQRGVKFGRLIKSKNQMDLINLLSTLEATDWVLKPRQ